MAEILRKNDVVEWLESRKKYYESMLNLCSMRSQQAYDLNAERIKTLEECIEHFKSIEGFTPRRPEPVTNQQTKHEEVQTK